jgi:hypothetical protein
MKALLFVLIALVSGPVFAQEQTPKTGLVFSESSGFVPQEHAYTAVCTIDESGVHFEKKSMLQDNGKWGNVERFNRSLSKRKFRKLVKKLHAASKGTIDAHPYPCDLGSNGLVGFVDGKEFPILQNVDCDATFVNLSKAAVPLAFEVEKLCGVTVRIELDDF